MAIEVLDNSLDKLWPMEVACARCESRLSINLDDLEFGSWKVSGYFFDGSHVCVNKYSFKCPVCGCEANGNEVPEDKIPLVAREELRSKAA